MNILVAGATGKTGRRLVDQLLKRNHQPIALVRDSSDTTQLPENAQIRKGDLTNLKDDVCDACDAVIFAAGSGGHTSSGMTDKVDRDGAKKLIDIASEAKVQRFVMLSSFGAENPDPDSDIGHYLQAKHEADEHLKASGLPYAILRPVALTDEDGTGNMLFGNEVSATAEAARGDVASVLARAIDEDQWLGKSVRMQST